MKNKKAVIVLTLIFCLSLIIGVQAAEDILYVDALGTEKPPTTWIPVGTTPYLNAQDEPNHYVWIDRRNVETYGDFNFTNSSVSGTIDSVYLYVYGYKVSALDILLIQLWNGSTWTPYTFTLTAYGWQSYNVSTVLDTWAKIDGAKIYLDADNNIPGGKGAIYVDAAYLNVSYSVPDTIAPNVTLTSPLNGATIPLGNASFNFTGTDGSGILNATLYTNFSGTWGPNESITAGLVSGVPFLINVTDAPEGGFVWNVLVCDDAASPNCAFNNTANFTLTVDRTAPTTILEFPPDNAYNDTSDPVDIAFNCSAADSLSNLVNISLYITNSSNQSFILNRSTVVTGLNTSANWTVSLSNGNYTWNCLAYDIAGNFDWFDSNRSIEINATVANNPPTIENMSIDDATTDPSEEIDLSPGATREVNCTGTATDIDDVTEISAVNATFFHITSSPTAVDNNETHYTNTSCTLGSAFGNSKNFTCSLQVWYFATNGSWTCNATVIDTSNAIGSGINTTTMNQLLAISVPDSIDYGTNFTGETSSTINYTVTNLGNVEIDIGVNGYGYTEGDGLAMNCTLGNISIEQEKYNLTALTPIMVYDAGMINLTNISVVETNFNLTKRTDASLNSTKDTFWAIRIPAGVGGTCVGAVKFATVLT
ncbi:hypothetical protein HQ533_02060 [Candidatus Woesearchaeota archaeon]|nr:hypothetical protein [Candidatus Woesearchaeota archaeon]